MLKKRLIGTVVVKDGWAVQSFRYNSYLPLGKPECLIENLDRWGADEILVLAIDRSLKAAGPDFDLLHRLSGLRLSTPLIYGGGIDSEKAGMDVIKAGADRICIDTLLHTNLGAVDRLSRSAGAQAIIAALPMEWDAETSNVKWWDYRSGMSAELPSGVRQFLIDGIISEALIIDRLHDGIVRGFDLSLLRYFPLKEVPLIAFGGLSEVKHIDSALSLSSVSAVSVGNFLNYREMSIQYYKEKLVHHSLRPSDYEQEESLLAYE